MKNILDSSFRYKPSFDTDVRKTMERVRRQRQIADDKCAACEPWFNASAFALPVNVANFRKVAHG